jgi:tetratricopeptide (TPR) repeat protein
MRRNVATIHIGGILVIGKFYFRLCFVIALLLVLACSGTVLGSPEDAALCKTKASISNPASAMDAIAVCTHQIENNPDDFESLFWRGVAYRALKRYEESVADLSKAIDLNPEKNYTRRMAYSDRAMNYKDLQKYDLAIADFKSARNLFTELELYDAWIAECYTQMGRKQEAIETWKDYIATIDANLTKDPKTILRKYYLEDKVKAQAEIEKLRK